MLVLQTLTAQRIWKQSATIIRLPTTAYVLTRKGCCIGRSVDSPVLLGDSAAFRHAWFKIAVQVTVTGMIFAGVRAVEEDLITHGKLKI